MADFSETKRVVGEFVAAIPSQDIASCFIVVFARMEYALKEETFTIAGAEGRAAEADWDRFAASVGSLEALPNPEMVAAIAFLYQFPPKRQIVEANVLVWSDAPPLNKSNRELYKMVRRIRNNLFHGGKIPFSQRDKDLLRAGLTLMYGGLALNDRVRARFLM